MYPRTFNPSLHHHPDRRKKERVEDMFTCKHCLATVHTLPWISGVQNRNHCPYCLWSRHVDLLKAGDRLSACKAGMQPIGLSAKPGRNKYDRGTGGELMVIHLCSECGKFSINRIAADDQIERLLEIFRNSSGLNLSIRLELKKSGISLLHINEMQMVIQQLYGISMD